VVATPRGRNVRCLRIPAVPEPDWEGRLRVEPVMLDLVLTTEPEAAEVAGAITPAPGGAGRITIAMFMSNTLEAAKPAAPV
jgi:Tetrahydrofolate dehydrogenase/cyclohydrolase, NAD(P)-binding domain